MLDRSPATSEADEVRATVEGAWRAIGEKDAAKAVSHYAADPVVFSMAPPLCAKGSQEQGLREWFATWRGPIRHESRDLHVAVGGDVAFCTAVQRIAGTKTDGAEVDLWFRMTVGLRRQGGRWKIVHEHESVPFYMDGSFRAAIDLTP